MVSDQHPTSAKSGDEAPVVYVVDDDESMRLALRNLLRSVGLTVETFGSVREFLSFPKAAVPSCLILDVRLRGESGLAFQQDMARSGMQMPVLFMTGYGDIEMSVKAMRAGALNFFPKPFRDQDMLDAVTEALARDAERCAAERSLAELRSAYDALTPREREVMEFVISGLMNKQIAAQMNLSEITVKIHRGQVMKKMAARSVPDLVRKAEALGVEPHRTRAP
ncbi:MAG TPA: response regulator [Trinickia sp.]|jgi:FixJ family two-component response regulator|uniref:response regulator transcription factor n=1 Tax=Trinickia sp. TaxID=2571163 RepID=UPI002BC6869A|nr:response regulator [Trinickia sp.]HTI19137.1 response regulator [Trinickia sp.]